MVMAQFNSVPTKSAKRAQRSFHFKNKRREYNKTQNNFHLRQLQSNSSRCTVVSVRYPSALDRWFETSLCAEDDDGNDYAEFRRSERIGQVLRLYSRDGHGLARKILARVRRASDNGPPPLDPVRRLTARPFQCLNLFVHDAAEVYHVLGRIRHILKYRPESARDRPAHVLLRARTEHVEGAPAAKTANVGNGGPWGARLAAASFDEYRDRVAARHRDARDIRSAYGMAMLPYVAVDELM